MSESAFKVGDFVERQYVRYQVIAINFEGNPVCFDKTREIPHTFHRTACRLIPGCESFDQQFPSPVPDCESGWRLLSKGRNPERAIEGDQFCYGSGQWHHSNNWKMLNGMQAYDRWYRRRVEPAADRPAEVLSAIRSAGKILRDAGIANVADVLQHEKLQLEAVGVDADGAINPVGEMSYAPAGGWGVSINAADGEPVWVPIGTASFETTAKKRVNPVVKEMKADDFFAHMASVFMAKAGEQMHEAFSVFVDVQGGMPTWHAGVGVDVVSREIV